MSLLINYCTGKEGAWTEIQSWVLAVRMLKKMLNLLTFKAMSVMDMTCSVMTCAFLSATLF